MRGRSALVKLRTETKNRIHAVMWKNGLESPVTSLFTSRGVLWLKSLEMEDHFKLSISKYLSVVKHLDTEIKDMEKVIREKVSETKEMRLLKKPTQELFLGYIILETNKETEGLPRLVQPSYGMLLWSL